MACGTFIGLEWLSSVAGFLTNDGKELKDKPKRIKNSRRKRK